VSVLADFTKGKSLLIINLIYSTLTAVVLMAAELKPIIFVYLLQITRFVLVLMTNFLVFTQT